MKNSKFRSKEFLKLRERAEELLNQYAHANTVSEEHDVYELVHELSVYQVELEMQNEELRQAQIDIEESRNQYVDLYDFAPISYFTFDADYCIQEVNFAGAELLGVERLKLNKKNFANFVSLLSKPVFYKHIKELLVTHMKQVCELELVQKKGQRCYVQMQVCLGLKQHIRATITDITVRRQTELKLIELTESLHLINNLFQSTSEAIAALDLQFRFIAFNQAFQQLFTKLFDSQVATGMYFLNALAQQSELQAKMMACCQQAVKGEEAFITYELSSPNESYFELKFNPIRDEHAQIIGLSYIVWDMTLYRFKERKLSKQRAEMEHIARMNTMGEMAAALAHEINQPLTVIGAYSAGCLEKLQKNISEAKQIASIMQKVLSQTEYAGNIIHRMKDFMREGKHFYELININDIITNTLELFEHEFKELKLELRYELAMDLPKLYVDQIQIAQVISNLVLNSMEAIKSTAISKPLIIIRTTYSADNMIIVDVIDNGPGIPAKLTGKILNSYFTSKAQGTGLGLAICRTLIESHGGHLLNKDDYTKGAWLQFSLPITANVSDENG